MIRLLNVPCGRPGYTRLVVQMSEEFAVQFHRSREQKERFHSRKISPAKATQSSLRAGSPPGLETR